MYPDSSQNQIWVQSATILFSDTSVTKVSGRYAEAEVYAQAGFGRTDRIYIISIIGFDIILIFIILQA